MLLPLLRAAPTVVELKGTASSPVLTRADSHATRARLMYVVEVSDDTSSSLVSLSVVSSACRGARGVVDTSEGGRACEESQGEGGT